MSTDVANLATLASCEETIERSEAAAWHALRRIHDEELWRADGRYGTWKGYVEQRWRMSRSRAHRLIDSARLVEHFKAQGITTLPTCEAHTRPLAALRRAGRKELEDKDFFSRAEFAWERAVESAPERFDEPLVTAKHVEAAVEQYVRKPAREKATLRDLRIWLTRGKRLLRLLGDPGKHDCSQLGGDFEPVLHALIDFDQRRPR